MNDYNSLVKNGNIGFYNGCEVTEIFIINKETRTIKNLYTIVVYEEFPKQINEYVTKENPIRIDDILSIGILRYNLSLEEAKENFTELKNNKKWMSNRDDDVNVDYPQIKELKKQFIPHLYESRLNKLLKNNFFNGSYILEFFDEEKDFDFLIENDSFFEEKCCEIEKFVPIDLYLLKDRLGNFIFQFPINIVEINERYEANLNNLNLEFAWHDKITENCTPPCLIEIESRLENSCVDFVTEEYTNTQQQIGLNGNFPPTNVKVLREDVKLLLYYNNNPIITESIIKTGIPIGMRKFTQKSKPKTVKIYNIQNHHNKNKNYIDYIQSSINRAHEYDLEENLSFKMYLGDEDAPLDDLITLINQYGMYGTWLWDPYLERNEIIDTLFFSPWKDVPLRALTVVNHKTSRFSKNSFKNSLKKFLNHSNNKIGDNKSRVKRQFKDMDDDYKGLNIEFRSQKEGNLHDRFLIFPGDSKRFRNPKVYSLGISVNNYGKQKHILQEVLYPQRIVDEFIKEWNKGECLWKFPK